MADSSDIRIHAVPATVPVLVGIAILLMLGSILWAAAESSVWEGLQYLCADRWGVVTLIDVYAGALVVATGMWIVRRSVTTWLIWVFALLCLGHLVSLIFLMTMLARMKASRPAHTT